MKASILNSSQDFPQFNASQDFYVNSLLSETSIQSFEPGVRKKPSVARHDQRRILFRIVGGRQPAAMDESELTRQELQWLADHREEYAGRWVALRGNRLVAVGDSAAAVYRQVGQRDDAPLVVQVEPRQPLPFAGW
jgi:hypothetical protein